MWKSNNKNKTFWSLLVACLLVTFCSLRLARYFLPTTCVCFLIADFFFIISLNFSLQLCSLCSDNFKVVLFFCTVSSSKYMAMIRNHFLFRHYALSIKVCSFTQIYNFLIFSGCWTLAFRFLRLLLHLLPCIYMIKQEKNKM